LAQRHPSAFAEIERLAKGTAVTRMPPPRALPGAPHVPPSVAAEHERNRTKIAMLKRRQPAAPLKPARSLAQQRMIDESIHAGLTRALRPLGLRPHTPPWLGP
jgi:hypothetical protein